MLRVLNDVTDVKYIASYLAAFLWFWSFIQFFIVFTLIIALLHVLDWCIKNLGVIYMTF